MELHIINCNRLLLSLPSWLPPFLLQRVHHQGVTSELSCVIYVCEFVKSLLFCPSARSGQKGANSSGNRIKNVFDNIHHSQSEYCEAQRLQQSTLHTTTLNSRRNQSLLRETCSAAESLSGLRIEKHEAKKNFIYLLSRVAICFPSFIYFYSIIVWWLIFGKKRNYNLREKSNCYSFWMWMNIIDHY